MAREREDFRKGLAGEIARERVCRRRKDYRNQCCYRWSDHAAGEREHGRY